MKTRFNLDAGAYLAPYGDARAEFGLPDEPEPMSKTSYPDAAVLVRSLEYGPGVVPTDYDAALDDMQVSYRFPVEYRVDLESWFGNSKLLVDLLSIAKAGPAAFPHALRLPGQMDRGDGPQFRLRHSGVRRLCLRYVASARP